MKGKALWYALKRFRFRSLVNLFLLIFFAQGLKYLLEVYQGRLGPTVFFIALFINLAIPETKRVWESFMNFVYDYFEYAERLVDKI